MFISDYYSTHEPLLFYTALICAVLVALAVIFYAATTALEKSRAKKLMRAQKILTDSETENAVFKTVATNEGLYAALYAGGKELARTKCYGAVAGVKSALKSLSANIRAGNFTVSVNADQSYSVKIFTANKIVFESAPFPSSKAAEDYIKIIKKAADKAIIE